MSKRAGDSYYKKAKQSGYLARSVYKLEEINKKYKIFYKGTGLCVMDLGASPGSWLQYLSSFLSPDSKLFGVDINPIKFVAPNVLTKEIDVFSNDLELFIEENYPQGFDIILSDMAPKTTGIRVKDNYMSYELASRAVYLAKKYLVPKGILVVKVFQGEFFKKLLLEAKEYFMDVKSFKPKSSRSSSYEIYLIIRGKK